MFRLPSTIRVIFLITAVSLIFLPTLQGEEQTFVDEYLYPEFNKTISLDFSDAELGNVLKVLSQQSGMNFVASDTIKNKRINLYLDNVRVWEALERILEANVLTYELRPGSNIFMVKAMKVQDKEFITRVYQLQHTPVPTHLINEALTFDDEIGSGNGESGSGSESSGSSETESKSERASEGIVAAVKSVLSEDGSIAEDKRTNSLIVTDYPSQFPLIELTIARLDVRVPQILIEAEMLDISKNTVDKLGAKWGETPVTFNAGEKDGLFPFDEDNIYEDNIARADQIPGARDSLYEDPRYRVSTLSFQGLQFMLQFLRTQTDTKNLARPRILTLNNQTATIAIKTDEVIGIQLETASADSGGASTEEAERTETGVFLKVTPQANVITREITMAVEPKVVQARASTFVGFQDPEERGTKSILRVLDGDTIIIGGLLRTDETDIRTRVPVMSRVPLLGSAFRHKDKTGIQRELIVFLTPHIVEEHLAKEKQQRVGTNFMREQNEPSSSRWNEINSDLSLMERY